MDGNWRKFVYLQTTPAVRSGCKERIFPSIPQSELPERTNSEKAFYLNLLVSVDVDDETRANGRRAFTKHIDTQPAPENEFSCKTSCVCFMVESFFIWYKASNNEKTLKCVDSETFFLTQSSAANASRGQISLEFMASLLWAQTKGWWTRTCSEGSDFQIFQWKETLGMFWDPKFFLPKKFPIFFGSRTQIIS